ncbi:putative bifunctional diguanylate cyclase/phosphodiesterase [Lichenibacterium ramalinae]|uniref:EAL domain-containing protein n=1 Tax=Lichenibacterium ramalinae TaxID=2316527 RepID=A0A4Q2RIH2_9HYPH|nr:EAL domain-containing protein [Lichenibacterium ramalinae]RYB07784.1 EAL domain-containing protein [Lichenibacterium ramalinae]
MIDATMTEPPPPPPAPDDRGGVGGDAARLALLDGLFQALPVGLDLRDPHGVAVLRNPAAEAAAAAAPEDLRATREAVTIRGDAYLLTTTVDLAAQRKVEAELFRRAYYDELTGLPNRSHLQHAVEELMERGSGPFALAFVDVDGFKQINDYYGHAVGDAILVKLARRIAAELPAGSLVGRIGGDEFVLLLRETDDVLVAVEALLARLKAPLFAEGHEIFASASVGVSLYPEHGRDYETLRRNADIAMYRVKSGRKGAAALFDEDMRMVAQSRMETEQRLRLAIRDRRFLCAYQPKVDIYTHRTVGLEVLLRWRDEAGFIQPPGEFIGLAVELGMINDISRMVLDETVAALGDIDAAFGCGTSISVNVAAKQAGDIGFMTDFAADLRATGCPERFMVELTEEAFFAKSELQSTVLPLLRGIGTKVSIDDFGVGYSSLSALADLTADEVKIDRSFVTDIHRRPRSQSILKAIESLGQALDMTIIAEGLESFEELTYLTAATTIRHAQGYYFSRPLALDQFTSSRTISYGSSRAAAPARMGAEARTSRTRGR